MIEHIGWCRLAMLAGRIAPGLDTPEPALEGTGRIWGSTRYRRHFRSVLQKHVSCSSGEASVCIEMGAGGNDAVDAGRSGGARGENCAFWYRT